jgi:iron complex outermembrane receptor protein
VSGNTSYINDGSVRYRGIEFEGNCALGAGLSVVANASIMRAQYQNSGIVSAAQQAGDSIPLVPNYLALAGLLYAHGPWSGSVLTKFVGPEYQGKNGSSDGPNFRVAAYSYTNLTISHALDQWVGPRHAQLRLQVNNIENKTLVTDVAGPSVAGPLLVNVLARRNYLVSISADL